MAIISITRNKLEQLKKLPKLPEPNSGKEGRCYFLNRDEVLKIYHVMSKYRQLNFTDETSEYIAFPKDIYLYEQTDLIIANTSPLLKGQKFSFGFQENLEIAKLLEAYIEIKDVIKKYPDILMQELYNCNMLYDYMENKFKIIDTSLWEKSYNATNVNLKNLTIAILSSLTEYNLHWRESYLKDIPKLHELYRRLATCQINEDFFLEFIFHLVMEVEERQGKVKTIGELTPNIKARKDY